MNRKKNGKGKGGDGTDMPFPKPAGDGRIHLSLELTGVVTGDHGVALKAGKLGGKFGEKINA